MTPRRYSFALRTVAAAAALAITGVGGGLPMCVSLLARAAAPCNMHTAHTGTPAHDFHPTTLNSAPSGDIPCHGDAQSPGCATGGLCPTGGAASLVVLGYSPISGAPTHGVAFQVAARHQSFVGPPLSPPPQA